MKEFDAIIIGFGKGGKTLATELAQHGWKVAVIERSDKMYGGTCINTGCIPTKALIHQAELATQKKGLSFEERKADYLLCGDLPYPAWKKRVSAQDLRNRRIRRYLVLPFKTAEKHVTLAM